MWLWNSVNALHCQWCEFSRLSQISQDKGTEYALNLYAFIVVSLLLVNLNDEVRMDGEKELRMTILDNPNPSVRLRWYEWCSDCWVDGCLKKEGLMIHLHFNNLQFLLRSISFAPLHNTNNEKEKNSRWFDYAISEIILINGWPSYGIW